MFPARYDDEVIIETDVVRAQPRLVAFRYRMRRAADGMLLAEGETTHIFCNRSLQRTKLPPKYWPLFGITSGAEPGR